MTNMADWFLYWLCARRCSIGAMATSPVCFDFLLHIMLLRGQGLEIEKEDIKQQDFNVLTPQGLSAIWLSQHPEHRHACML